MDDFGELFSGLGDMVGDLFGGNAAGAEGALGFAGLFSGDDRQRADAPVIVYERYLCGGPRRLHINDR